jgi:uncharacterized protein YvpB
VQYFDKGRLEVTDAATNPSLVSSGLLVRELSSGAIQLGDASYQFKASPDLPLAGDLIAANPNPTYQTLAAIASLNNDHPSPNRLGQIVTQTMSKSGQVGNLAVAPASVRLVQFEPNLKHNIPDVFWNFMQQRGTVWQNDVYVANQLVFDWQQTIGLPLTEAYWTTAIVAGQSRAVMVQAFERRLLTFTPTNPTPFKVEMGNVGAAYYQWRYAGHSAPPVVVPAPVSDATKVVLPNFPIYAQQHNLSCEYASTRMMTAFWGAEISEAQFISQIPFHSNPHVGYRGNINGPFGGTTDYGIYPDPIAQMLEQHSFKTKLLAGGVESLKQELNLGHPVQVWIVAGFGYATPFTSIYEGLDFKLVAGEHSVVVYGYDTNGVYIADPAYGGRNYVSWPNFLRNWNYFDQMALSIWPANILQPVSSDLGVAPYFYRYWLNTSGKTLFGLPGTPAYVNGTQHVVQYFEQARLEYDLLKPYNQPIIIGALGSELTAGRTHEKAFQAVPPPASDVHTLFFQATQHSVSNGFLDFWEKHGDITVFGYPLSQEFVENGLVVQYFERARFEYHPDQPEGAKVLLGKLGLEWLKSHTSPTPTSSR